MQTTGSASQERLPWVRQFNESRQSFHGYAHYRDLGPTRSIDKAWNVHVETCLKPAVQTPTAAPLPSRRWRVDAPTTWRKWSVRWDWVARADAWDEDLDRQAQEARRQAVREMNERHMNLAKAFQGKVIERIRQVDATTLSNLDLPRWLELAVKIERQAMGEATESIQVAGGGGEESDHDREIRHALLRNPNLRRLAITFLAELSSGDSDAGGVGVGSERPSLAPGQAPAEAE